MMRLTFDALLEWTENIEQTPEEAEAELEAAGCDVGAFLRVLHRELAARGLDIWRGMT